MSIILAIEPDRRQAAHVSAIVRHRVRAELILADTTEGALDAIGSQVPDLVLVPALLSPQDDAALNAALRVIAAAAHVRTLTIPVFANNIERAERGGLLSRWRRGRGAEAPTPDGCDPAVFAEQISDYLREAAAERAAVVQPEHDQPAPIAERELVARVPPAVDAAPAPPIAPIAEIAEIAAAPIDEFEPVPVPMPDDRPEPIVVTEPTLVTEPAIAAPEPVADSPVAPAAEIFVQPVSVFDEPVFEFAPSSELAERPLAPIAAGSDDVEETAIDEPGDNELVIDLSGDIAEIPPEPDEELYDGEKVGVYTMPSFDEEFMIGDDEPIATLQHVGAVPRVETEPTLDLTEFEDETIAAFAVIDELPIVAQVAKPEARLSPIAEVVLAVDDMPEAAPIAARARDDGWISMGIRHVWAWPPLEGVDAESPSPLVALEDLSEALVAAPRPNPPVALPKPHVVPAPTKADHMEWAELIASLRQDIERRRSQPAQVTRPRPPAPVAPVPDDMRPKRRSTPVQDEWGFFDPHQCGFAALLEKLDQITDTDDDVDGRRPA